MIDNYTSLVTSDYSILKFQKFVHLLLQEKNKAILWHCSAGKDRTGFVCMLIEALAGTSYQDIVDDYMITYDNYYEISQASDPERYATIKEKNIDLMLHYVISDEAGERDLSTINNYSDYTKSYLLSIGMGEDTITQLIQNLSS